MTLITRKGVRYGLVLRVDRITRGLPEIGAVLTDLGFENVGVWNPIEGAPPSMPPQVMTRFGAVFPSFLAWAEGEWLRPNGEVKEEQGDFEILECIPIISSTPTPKPAPIPAPIDDGFMSVPVAAIFGGTLLVGTLLWAYRYSRRG